MIIDLIGGYVLAGLLLDFRNAFLDFPLLPYRTFQRENEMPIAVASSVPIRKNLKTLPADPSVEGPAGEQGYVMIRRLTFGEKMTRRSLNSKMTVKATKGKRDVDTMIDTFNAATDLFDFANCIIAHNLTDEKGAPLNFKTEAHVRLLASNVAEEIQTYMDELNNFEADDEVGE